MSTTINGQPSLAAAPPPPVSVVRAMLWNWWVVAVSVVLFVGIGVAYGLLRTPEYSATTKMQVGRIDVTAPGALSGYAAATSSLATGYSRTVTALGVARQVSTKTGVPVKEVQSLVNATPVPESPVFKIEASGSSPGQAIALANDSAHALIDFSARLNHSNPDSARLFHEYRRAIVESKVAEQRLRTIVAAAPKQPTASQEAQTDAARGAAAAASLRVTAIGRNYTTSLHDQAATQLIQVISPATEASSDRRSKLTIAAFIGLVAGLLVGGALAVYRESRFQPKPA